MEASNNGHSESDRLVVGSLPENVSGYSRILGYCRMRGLADKIIVGATILVVGWLIWIIRKIEKEQ